MQVTLYLTKQMLTKQQVHTPRVALPLLSQKVVVMDYQTLI